MVVVENFVESMKNYKYPYIVPYYSAYREGKNIIIVMENYEKGTLGMFLDKVSEQGTDIEEDV
jgi:serine/threonine protein kinase